MLLHLLQMTTLLFSSPPPPPSQLSLSSVHALLKKPPHKISTPKENREGREKASRAFFIYDGRAQKRERVGEGTRRREREQGSHSFFSSSSPLVFPVRVAAGKRSLTRERQMERKEEEERRGETL